MQNGDRLLVVNADDLGLHPDINRGIEKAHVEGVVTSASLSPAGEAFEDALAVCRRCPDLGVGVHLTLVEERPLTDPLRLGSLATRAGLFPDSYRGLLARVLAGWVSPEAVRRELGAQVQRVLDAGIRPSHVDAHQHVHLLPGIWHAVVELAVTHGVPWVRMPRFSPLRAGEPSALLVALRAGMNALEGVRRGSMSSLRAVDATPALGLSGHLTTETILAGVADVPGGAVAELVTHPGVTTPALEARYRWGYDWSGETAALTDPALRDALTGEGFTLRSFADLAA